MKVYCDRWISVLRCWGAAVAAAHSHVFTESALLLQRGSCSICLYEEWFNNYEQIWWLDFPVPKKEKARGGKRGREREGEKLKVKERNCPTPFCVFLCLWTDTDIITVVTCRYDADMTVYRSFSHIFLSSNASRVAGRTCWHGLIKISIFNIQFDCRYTSQDCIEKKKTIQDNKQDIYVYMW